MQKTVLVTGACINTGVAIVEKFASEKWDVVFTGRDAEKVSAAEKAYRIKFPDVKIRGYVLGSLQKDGSVDENGIRELFNEMDRAGIFADCLVLNASDQGLGQEIFVTPLSDFARVIYTNVIWDYALSEAAASRMKNRGGGSIEDLWGFNSEDLVHCIYHLKTPVVSGVGHESDTTLVDYVCDLRAPTPTGAAQRATPDQRDVLRLLYSHKQYLSTRMKQLLDQQKGALTQRRHHRYLQDPYSYVKDRQMHLAMAQTQLERIGDAMLENKTKLIHLKQLLVHSLQQCVSEQRQLCSHKEEQLKEQLGLYYAREAQKLSSRMTLLDAYSPLAVLKRGYTLVEQDGMLCKSASALQQESEVRIRFHDGKWRAKLLEKEEDHEGKINI